MGSGRRGGSGRERWGGLEGVWERGGGGCGKGNRRTGRGEDGGGLDGREVRGR